ncbi:MAG: copper resistance protein CopC [Proteobacteria bacterium]|nr:copper resistance protein CopC [Pseudomonadota bacterium]
MTVLLHLPATTTIDAHQGAIRASSQDTNMIERRIFLALGAAAAVTAGRGSKAAEPAKVLETMPANGARIDGAATDYYVRFSQPVDHIHSVLLIKQNGSVVQTLQPRFKTEPTVLFARAPSMKPGDYTFHWVVKSLAGTETTEGEVPFSVGQ